MEIFVCVCACVCVCVCACVCVCVCVYSLLGELNAYFTEAPDSGYVSHK
jgi:hypothetical protein